MDLAPICAFDVLATADVTQAAHADPFGPVPQTAVFRWVHLDMADPGVAAFLESRVPDVVHQALLQAETRPRCDRVDDGILINLRGVNLNPGSDADDMVSLRLWVTQSFVVSIRSRKVFAVDALRTAMATDPPPDVGAWLVRLTEGLVDRIEDVSVSKDDATGLLEEGIFGGGGGTAPDIGPLRASVYKLRRFVGPQQQALHRLTTVALPFLDPHREALREVTNRATRTVEELDAVAHRLTAVQDHHHTEAADRMGRHSYILSVVAAIFLPLGFLTGLFGVNVAGMPGLEWPFAFALLCVGSLGLGVLAWGLMRWLKWL